MDRNLHTDDFERLLREKSDEFRMYPSKRIWSSIYNNIHPGRKWPSVVMSITLISSLLMIGYLNTKDSDTFTQSTTNKNLVNPLAVVYQNLAINNGEIFNPFTVYSYNSTKESLQELGSDGSSNNNSKNDNIGSLTSPTNSNGSDKLNKPINTNSAIQIYHPEMLLDDNNAGKSIDVSANKNNDLASGIFNKQSKVSIVEQPGFIENELASNLSLVSCRTIALMQLKPTSKGFSNVIINNEKTLDIPKGNSKIAKTGKLSSVKKATISNEEKEWIDNYAMYNRPAPKKWAGKLAWEMYATPSIVYRTLTTNAAVVNSNNSAPFLIQGNNTDIENDIIQKPSFGFELGTGIQYPIFKDVKLKTGIQFNFTRFNTQGFHNTHPVSTKLTMYDAKTNSTYELFRTTPYSNKAGLKEVNLHNQTFQVSIPVGLDFKILGNENIQWNVGVTVQPTYVIGGASYLLSSDRRNYVKESSMFNRFNLNAGFETFISYKSNGITYEIGPQFRSQLFSTNKNFAIEEKLQNYGIKFGIIKTLK
ncbi:hypothetical protein BH11BAC3_BH11BAC3_12560 [soil metagenome]